MNKHVYIQARVCSERLPGKILKKVCGKTLINIIFERAKKINGVNKIVVVTGTKDKNNNLIEELERLDIDYFCGSEENVLDRFYNASLHFSSDVIVRITGDNPLIDPDIISKGLEIFDETHPDILSVDRIHSFPHGMNFEIFKKDTLVKSWKDNLQLFDSKEDFYNTFINPVKHMLEKKKFVNYDMVNKERLDNLRLTVDYKEDFLVVEKIFQSLYKNQEYFGLKDILEYLEENPSLLDINKKYAITNTEYNLEQ